MSFKFFLKTQILQLGALLYANKNSKVIYYHDIHKNHMYTSMSTDVRLFKKHIDEIKSSGYKIVSEIKEKKHEVQITFDDGFRGLYENFSFFKKENIPVKIFLIADYIGKKNYIKKNEITELLNTGLVTIGSHTLSHCNLNELSDEEINRELQKSKQKLEEMFDVTINEICYPRGQFDDRVVNHAKECGYKLQYSCLPGSFYKPFVEGVIKRNFVQHENPNSFRSYLNGGGEIFYARYLKQHYKNKN